MGLSDNTLPEELASNLRCPCGYDIQKDDVYRETAHNIGEVYLHPYCPECNHYNNSYKLENTDWWVGE